MSETRPRCSCGKLAIYFGRFAGGVCEQHADQMIAEGFLSQFHEGSRERLQERLPFKPGDWVADHSERVARVMRVYRYNDEVLLDLSIYSHKGDRVGRQSPACGGPKSFEPACDAQHWERIRKPSFPMEPKWVPNGDGRFELRLWAGERLPPANWTLPAPRSGMAAPSPELPPFLTREEYAHLADLFSSANDPISAAIGQKAAQILAWLERRPMPPPPNPFSRPKEGRMV